MRNHLRMYFSDTGKLILITLTFGRSVVCIHSLYAILPIKSLLRSQCYRENGSLSVSNLLGARVNQFQCFANSEVMLDKHGRSQ